MDNLAVINLAAALEIEFEALHRRLTALAATDDASVFESQVNALIDELPSILATVVGVRLSSSILHSILATHYLEGVKGTFSGKLLRPDKAYELVSHTGLLQGSVNPLAQTERAMEVRATAVSKVIKGQIVQDIRNWLKRTDGMNLEQAQATVSELADELGDLSHNSHIRNHIDAQTQLAKGYGQFTIAQQNLRTSPFQEFYRAEHRSEWRDWPARWNDQGGRFFDGPSDYPQGRMIAEVNSRIWENLSDPDLYSDGTGSPYPPFAYNSGMSVKPVSQDEAVKLGLFGTHKKPKKAKRLDFNAGIAFSADFDPDIQDALLNSMQDWVESKGELHTKEAA